MRKKRQKGNSDKMSTKNKRNRQNYSRLPIKIKKKA